MAKKKKPPASQNINISGSHSGNSSVFVGGDYTKIVHKKDIDYGEYAEKNPIALKLGSYHIKRIWVFLSGLLITAGDMAGVYNNLDKLPSLLTMNGAYVFLIIVTLGIPFIIGVVLLKAGVHLFWQKNFQLYPSLWFLYSISDGSVFLARVEGDCPRCSGKLILAYDDSKPKKLLICCTRNPKHSDPFSFKTLLD